MAIIKKNLFSIILGVIAILAVAAKFYPLGGMVEKLKTEAGEHATKAEAINALANKPHNLPIVKPGSTENEPLGRFPTKQDVAEGKTANELVAKAADDVTKKSSEINEHKPLVRDALPGVPGQLLPASTFAREYVRMFPPPAVQGNASATPPTSAPSRPDQPTLTEILHAGTPPSNAEMDQARVETEKKIREENTRYSGGAVINQEEVNQLVLAEFKNLADNMRLAVAKKCLVYVGPDAFSLFTGMTVASQPAPTEIFWAQIGLWVQEDVCRAIYGINSKFENVTLAPVKQIIKVSFVQAGVQGTNAVPGAIPVFVVPNLAPSGGIGAGGPAPVAVGGGDAAATPSLVPAGDPTAALTRNNLLSPTGRQSNPLFDVVQFDVELIVDAATVPQVLEGLGAKQYICVTQVLSVDPVDSAVMRGAGNHIGDKPCVKIKARCEELFFRSWLGQYVPQSLKTILGYPAPQQQQPA